LLYAGNVSSLIGGESPQTTGESPRRNLMRVRTHAVLMVSCIGLGLAYTPSFAETITPVPGTESNNSNSLFWTLGAKWDCDGDRGTDYKDVLQFSYRTKPQGGSWTTYSSQTNLYQQVATGTGAYTATTTFFFISGSTGSSVTLGLRVHGNKYAYPATTTWTATGERTVSQP
jgi:hypothetical protein